MLRGKAKILERLTGKAAEREERGKLRLRPLKKKNLRHKGERFYEGSLKNNHQETFQELGGRRAGRREGNF